jgi:hypothetical protein
VCRALKAQPKCDLYNLQIKLLQQVARLIVLDLQHNTSVAGTVSHLPEGVGLLSFSPIIN